MGQTRVNIITLLTLRNKPRKYISQVIGFAEQNCYYKLDKGTLSLGQISKIAKSLNSEAIPIMNRQAVKKMTELCPIRSLWRFRKP